MIFTNYQIPLIHYYLMNAVAIIKVL